MNTKNKLGFKYFLVISGMAICLLFTSSCGKLTRYGMNSEKSDQESVKNNIRISSIPTIDSYGYLPLHLAAYFGDIDMVKSLLAHPSILVNKKGPCNYTPLHIASKKGHLEVVQELLNNSEIKINEQSRTGQTPLHLAVLYKRIEVVKELLKHSDIQVNKKNKRNTTPLNIAAYNGNIETVKVLLLHPDIQVNKQDIIGEKSFYISENDREEVVKLLREAGAVSGIKNN